MSGTVNNCLHADICYHACHATLPHVTATKQAVVGALRHEPSVSESPQYKISNNNRLPSHNGQTGHLDEPDDIKSAHQSTLVIRLCLVGNLLASDLCNWVMQDVGVSSSLAIQM